MEGVERLAIEQEKFDLYLLNPHHPDGGSKAKFFLSRGYRADAAVDLGTALALHAEKHWPGTSVFNGYVTKHIIAGPMSFPDGSTRDMLAIWKIAPGDTTAWFVTAYPSRKRPSPAA